MLGMAPSRYRAGGAGEAIAHVVLACSLGLVLVAATATGICAILLGAEENALLAELQSRFPRAASMAAPEAFAGLAARVVALIDDPAAPHAALPLDIRGTVFQRRVWEMLRTIPPGQTLSYAALAARLGSPGGARAVAGACAGQRPGGGDPVPPRGRRRWRSGRLPVGACAQAGAVGARARLTRGLGGGEPACADRHHLRRQCGGRPVQAPAGIGSAPVLCRDHARGRRPALRGPRQAQASLPPAAAGTSWRRRPAPPTMAGSPPSPALKWCRCSTRPTRRASP